MIFFNRNTCVEQLKYLSKVSTWDFYHSAPNCIKHFHRLFWLIRTDITIVSIGNNCNVKPDWPESLLGTDEKSDLIDQRQLVNQGNPLYNWVQVVESVSPE